MPTSPKKSVRIPEATLTKIHKARGERRFSTWALEAFRSHLEGERGLGASYRQELVNSNRQLVAVGRNLNQLTRTANSGKPVTINDRLVRDLLTRVNEVRNDLHRVERLLP